MMPSLADHLDRLKTQPIGRPLVVRVRGGWMAVVRTSATEVDVRRWPTHHAAIAHARWTAVEPLPSAVDLAEQPAAA